MDFTNSNRAMRQMLQLLMQRMMGEESLERQKEYVDYSSDVYGKRQQENLAATEASRLRVGETEHGRTMKEKSYSLMADLSKLEPIKQLRAEYFMSQDPARREAIQADLASTATLVGNMFDLGQNGQPIPAEMYTEAMKQGLSVDELQKIFDGTRARMANQEEYVVKAADRAQRETAGARTAGLQEERLAFDKQKLAAGVGVKAAPGAGPDTKTINTNVWTSAKDAMTKLQADLKAVDMDPGFTDQTAPAEKKRIMTLLGKLSKIKSRAATHSFTPEDAQSALDYVDSVYGGEAPAEEDAGLDTQTSANLMMEKAKRAYIQRLVTKWGIDPNTAKAMADKKFRML
jgi:hypothetical protein